MKLDNQKIAIIGGGGFLGGHLVNKLSKQKNCQIIIPERKDGWDFRQLDTCQKFFTTYKPNIVINCAAWQGGIGFHSGKQADLYYDNLLMGTFLMKAAQENNVNKFVNIVAGCSYPGYLEKEKLSEIDYWNGEVHESIFSYGFSRKTTTAYGLALKKQFNFNSIHLIMANMYGPKEHFNPEQSKALAGLIKKIYEAKINNIAQVEIWGTGKPIRDWLYVEDGVEGILKATELYDEVEPLNIAYGQGISIYDLAKIIKKIVNYQGEFFFNTDKPDGAMKKIFDTKKMQKKLQWLPTTTMEQGIKETVDWFINNYEYAIKK